MACAGPMQTARSAMRAGIEFRSASDTASTVSIPSPRQVRMIRAAISPRLAMSRRWIGTRQEVVRTRASVWPYSTSSPSAARISLTLPAHSGAHRIHELHDLDDADDGVFFDRAARLDEGWRAGFRGAIEGAEQWRRHWVQSRIVQRGRGTPGSAAAGTAAVGAVPAVAAGAQSPRLSTSFMPSSSSCSSVKFESSSNRVISSTSLEVRLMSGRRRSTSRARADCRPPAPPGVPHAPTRPFPGGSAAAISRRFHDRWPTRCPAHCRNGARSGARSVAAPATVHRSGRLRSQLVRHRDRARCRPADRVAAASACQR